MLFRSLIKVMDFGIARALSDANATMTSTWNVIGTAQYLSPEQAQGLASDRRSDIYSVGCVLYELLVGEPPFSGDTPIAIAYQHVSADLVPASDYVEELDKNIDTILTVALSKDPAHRYQDAGAMLDDKSPGIITDGAEAPLPWLPPPAAPAYPARPIHEAAADRKSTRLNSSH